MPEVSNIYDQSIELADVSYLVYSMASLYHVLHEKEEFSSNRETETWYFPDVQKVLNKYKKELEESKYKENFFGKGAVDSFTRLSEWAKENEPEHAKDIYMTHINVKNMKNEMVYGVLVDKVHKRIVVVFRGTESFAGGTGMYHNIMSDVNIFKTKEDLPASVAGKPEGGIKHVWLHKGFHNYFNEKTSNDDEMITPKDQMLLYVKEEIKNHPDYTICCTGHSLGASLSTLGAYYLALDEEIPKPVNNINFQSPRLGDTNFLKACRYLEEKGDLQICRFSNDNDLIANSPSMNYFHVGIEIRMPKNAQKSLTRTYPRANMSTFSWEWAGSLWRGSFFANLDFTYDHGDYVDRLKVHKKALEDMKTLREMYQNTELTGFAKN